MCDLNADGFLYRNNPNTDVTDCDCEPEEIVCRAVCLCSEEGRRGREGGREREREGGREGGRTKERMRERKEIDRKKDRKKEKER